MQASSTLQGCPSRHNVFNPWYGFREVFFWLVVRTAACGLNRHRNAEDFTGFKTKTSHISIAGALGACSSNSEMVTPSGAGMFSKLKKLVSKDEDKRSDGASGAGTSGHVGKSDLGRNSASVRSMDSQLQRKFGKGVHYNMKIVIRGERNVGKSCLFWRLQGGNFRDDYVPSEEIQVTNITWNFKTTDDVVKVEIWDVVDKGKKKKALGGLKVHNTPQNPGDSPEAEVGLDAETLDVYKGSHGIIMILDWTKPWTFDYVKQELPRAPPSLPVLLLINFRDVDRAASAHGSTVSLSEIRSYIHHLDRPKSAAPILIAESSMKNGFGLKYMHRFFSLPFLQLQRENLQRQVAQNRHDMELTFKELESLLESEEQNYDKFLRTLMHGPSKTTVQTAPDESSVPSTAPPDAKNGTTKTTKAPSTKNGAAPEPFIPAVAPGPTQADVRRQSRASNSSRVKHIDDFVPEDDLSGEFLDDHVTNDAHRAVVRQRTHADDSSDEEVSGNPMVAGFQDEIDLDLDNTAVVEKALSSFVANAPAAQIDLPTEDPVDTLASDHEAEDASSDLVHLPVEIRAASPNEDSERNVIFLPTSVVDDQPDESPAQEPQKELSPPPVFTQLSSFELSSWLQGVEERTTAPPVQHANLPESSVVLEPEVESSARKKKKDKMPKKDKSTKSGGKSKTQKESKPSKATTKSEPKPTAFAVPKPVRKPSEEDNELSMAKELEEFLASEDE